MNEQTSATSAFETFLYALIGVIVAVSVLIMFLVSVLGEWVILLLAALALAGFGWFIVWLFSGWLTWLWGKIGDKREDWADRNQARQLQADTVRTQLLLECKRAELAYAIDGMLPVAHAAIVGGDYTKPLLELAARRIDTLAPVPNVPHSLTYSPHVSQKAEAGALLPEMPHSFIAPATDFYGLFMGGKLPRDRFLVGTSLEDGSEVHATWQNLYSALIGGMSGSGKSTLIRSLLAQSALQGGRFVVIDPHYGAGEESLGASLQPLRNLMLCDVASNDREMLSALRFVADIGQRRLSGQDTDKTPVVLVVDETTGILQRGNVSDQLIDVLGMISQETRKVGLYAFCIGQNFSGKVLPTEVRNSFVSFISCRARKDVARVQSGSNEFGEMAADLTIGQAVWMTPAGEVHRVSVPNCTQNHLQHVAANLDQITVGRSPSTVLPQSFQSPSAGVENAIVEVPWKESGSTVEGVPEGVQLTTLTPQQALIVEMYKRGESHYKIASEVFGVTGGRRYEDAVTQIHAAIRMAMR